MASEEEGKDKNGMPVEPRPGPEMYIKDSLNIGCLHPEER